MSYYIIYIMKKSIKRIERIQHILPENIKGWYTMKLVRMSLMRNANLIHLSHRGIA